MMVPAGKITEDTFQKLLGILEPGDTIVDGGNSNFRDSQRRAKEARKQKIRFVDAGVSGGIWGLEVGFCLMAGGDKGAVKRLTPVFESLAPENGYAHVGPSGAGHFMKMVHNGIEYGLMQAYAEGFELMYHSEFELDLGEIAGIWRYGSVVRSWLLELLHEALRAARRRISRTSRRYVEDSGEGRWTINEAIDENVPAAGDHRRALRPVRLAPRDRLLRQGAGGAPQPVRRARGQGGRGGEEAEQGPARVSSAANPLLEGLRLRRTPDPCALVIFGASGDLTQRKLFPALYSLAFRGLLPEQLRGRRRRPHGADDEAVRRRR